MKILILIMWICLIYASAFMLLYEGEISFAKYHGFIIWGASVIVVLVVGRKK